MAIKYDLIGKDYNTTRKADPYLTQRLSEHLNPSANGVYLDIGCGTGNYTCELSKSGARWIGIDPSIRMLEIAAHKDPGVDWRIGTAEDIPLAEEAVDGIIAFLTIHHWKDLKIGFEEIYRVLKKDGTVVFFTSTPEQMERYWLNHYFPQMLKDSMEQMPDLKRIEKNMAESGLQITEVELYQVRSDLTDHFLYCGKHRPELYLENQIRRGISSFSSLANKSEIEQGLKVLRSDIETGKIQEIVTSYSNDLGDYLFLTGKKRST